MTAIFTFDDGDEHIPRTRRDTAPSINSFDDRWAYHSEADQFDSQTRMRQFNGPWDTTVIAEEEDESPLRVGTPPIKIPNGNGAGSYRHEARFARAGSVQVELDEEFISAQVGIEGSLNRKMVPGDFEQVRVLGKGGYGTVLLVRHKITGRLFAQKQLKKASLVFQKKIVEYTKSERNILEEIKNPFVVKLFYAFQDSNKLYLILEYAAGGELFHHLDTEKMFAEDVASFYVAEVFLALTALHKKGIVYRDLKPENCLLDAEGHLLLTDFGLSKVADEDADCNSFCGTCEYMSPEMCMGNTYSYEVDYWAMGILLHELLTGSPPFTGNNNRIISDRIIKTKLKLPYYLSPDAKDILTKLLKKVPSARLGSKDGDIQRIKQHRLFRKIDWSKLERRELEPPIQPVITDPAEAENFPRFNALPLPNSPPTFGAGARDIGINHKKGETNGAGSLGSSLFQGFTYTASSSFIDRFLGR